MRGSEGKRRVPLKTTQGLSDDLVRIFFVFRAPKQNRNPGRLFKLHSEPCYGSMDATLMDKTAVRCAAAAGQEARRSSSGEAEQGAAREAPGPAVAGAAAEAAPALRVGRKKAVVAPKKTVSGFQLDRATSGLRKVKRVSTTRPRGAAIAVRHGLRKRSSTSAAPQAAGEAARAADESSVGAEVTVAAESPFHAADVPGETEEFMRMARENPVIADGAQSRARARLGLSSALAEFVFEFVFVIVFSFVFAADPGFRTARRHCLARRHE